MKGKDGKLKWAIMVALLAIVIIITALFRACGDEREDPDPVENPSSSQQVNPNPVETDANDKETNNPSIKKNIRVEIIGDKEVYIEKGDTFEDPGAKVYIDGTEVVDALVEVTSELDTSKVGEYVIIYEYDDAYDTRTVYVVDTTPSDPPVISSSKPANSATPNVTSRPQVTVEPTPSASSEPSTEPTVTPEPEHYKIERLGDEVMEVEEGSKFVDPGVRVRDQDGKLRTDVKVTVTGYVNTNKVGTYTLTYSVEGFKITRIVKVVAKQVVETNPPVVTTDPPVVTTDPPVDPPPQPSDTEIEDNPAETKPVDPPPQPSDTEIEDKPAESKPVNPPPQPSDTEIEDSPATK